MEGIADMAVERFLDRRAGADGHMTDSARIKIETLHEPVDAVGQGAGDGFRADIKAASQNGRHEDADKDGDHQKCRRVTHGHHVRSGSAGNASIGAAKVAIVKPRNAAGWAEDGGRIAYSLLIVAGLGLLLSGCAYQPVTEAVDPPGFFSGLLHGVISPYAVIVGLFSEVRVYAYPNSGWFYDFGFMTGLLPWAFSAISIGARSAAS